MCNIIGKGSCKEQIELALTLGVTAQARWYDLKLGIIQKQREKLHINWSRKTLKVVFVPVKCYLLCLIFLYHSDWWCKIDPLRWPKEEDHMVTFQYRQLSWIFMKKIHIVFVVGSICYRVLWVAQTGQNTYWGSFFNTIDDTEPSNRDKTLQLLLQTRQN